jgi:hypothetical protein
MLSELRAREAPKSRMIVGKCYEIGIEGNVGCPTVRSCDLISIRVEDGPVGNGDRFYIVSDRSSGNTHILDFNMVTWVSVH